MPHPSHGQIPEKLPDVATELLVPLPLCEMTERVVATV